MKKLYTLSLLMVGALSFGQNILTETFSYAVPGNIGGNTTTATDATGSNNWLTHSNTVGNAGTIDVISGSLSYPGLTASAGNKVYLPGSNSAVPRDINRAITSTATTLYYSALINVLDNTQLTANPTYFFGFGGAAGVSVTTLGARLGIASSNAGANFRLSIQNISGGTPTFTENAVDLTFGTTYLVVVKYDAAASPTNASLWVNPSSLGGTEPASTVTNNSGTQAFATFASVYIRNAAGGPKTEIDEIRVGTTWASVTPVSLSVKESAIAGLKVYPNPVTGGKLFISTDANSEKAVVIFDVLGKQVVNTTATESVNVSNLKGGVYIVKITEDGKTATRKLVIK